ncbi:transcriptional coactivator Hfi1p/ADA1 [[Candida] railenensis]|uniref:Transcriptional coactivator Hfi1p/ADA1 n=1 Tax=[Candida] railenensis TaxID=45579 RepID=A0A9P0QR54_9ASCO|nr:transcriptional coactivator Hfi1p/ADA1 [[Candida] railenensis]
MSLPSKPNSHIELENHIREFQNKLGNDWDKYQETLSLFLIGKLSRNEMVDIITPILKGATGGAKPAHNLVKFHNKLLLMNFANSLKDGPLDPNSEFASFWNKKNSVGKPKNVKSSQYEKFKQNIMGLPIRERRRIKNISRESGKKGKLSASITLTRHSMLPKIPMIQDKQQQQSHVNNLVQWQQDVVNGINTPIATDNYEIPDYDNLSTRMIMIMREYGLTGGLNPQVMEVLLLGLEVHLKNIVESAIDVARYRETKYASNDFLGTGDGNIFPGAPSSTALNGSSSLDGALNGTMSPDGGENGGGNSGVFPSNSSTAVTSVLNANSSAVATREDEISQERKRQKVTLNAEDLFDTLEMFPHLIEPNGPKLRLSNVLLQNDDMVKADELDYELPPRFELLAAAPSTLLTNGSIKEEIEKNGTSDKTNKDDKEAAEETEKDLKKAGDPIEGKSELKTSGDKDVKTEEATKGSTSLIPQVPQKQESHIGTNDELKWLLHDLISTI